MLYVWLVPLHTAVGPVIVPGTTGVPLGATANTLWADVPQALLAVTVTLPAVALVVAVMLVAADVPVHPPGSVHAYDVAPGIAATE